MKLPEKMNPIMKAIKAIHSVAEGEPSISPEDLERQRAGQDLLGKLVKVPVGVEVSEFEIDGMPAAWHRPKYIHDKRHVILYCHGGGYTCGNLCYAGIIAGKLALHTGLDVLVFEYRLAPDHPYPAAIEDGAKAWDYLMLQGYGARDVILAGDSAGGNLALELTRNILQSGRLKPRALVLMSPWTDMTISSESYETCAHLDPLLTKEYIRIVRDAYLGDRTDYANPDFSPLFGSFEGFPRTYIQVGLNEILLDDSLKLAEKIQKENGLVKLSVYENGWHVFQQMPMKRAIEAVQDIGAWVQSILV